MVTRVVDVEPNSELGLLLDSIEDDTVVLQRAGVRFRVSRDLKEPFQDYEPERVKASFRKASGMLRGLDVDAFVKEMKIHRGQDSGGRPTD